MLDLFVCPLPALDFGQLWPFCRYYEKILHNEAGAAPPLNARALQMRVGSCLCRLILRERARASTSGHCFAYSPQMAFCLLNNNTDKAAIDAEPANNHSRQAIINFLGKLTDNPKSSTQPLKLWLLYECLYKLGGAANLNWLKKILSIANPAQQRGASSEPDSCSWAWLPILGHWLCICTTGKNLRYNLAMVKWQNYA